MFVDARVMCPGINPGEMCPAVEIQNRITAILLALADSNLNLLPVEERDVRVQTLQAQLNGVYDERDTFVHCTGCTPQRSQTA